MAVRSWPSRSRACSPAVVLTQATAPDGPAVYPELPVGRDKDDASGAGRSRYPVDVDAQFGLKHEEQLLPGGPVGCPFQRRGHVQAAMLPLAALHASCCRRWTEAARAESGGSGEPRQTPILGPASPLHAPTTTAAAMRVTWPEPISKQHPTDNDQQVDDRDEDPAGAARGGPVDQHPERTEHNNDEPQPQEVPRQGRPRSSWPAAATGTAGTFVIVPLRPPGGLIAARLNAHTSTVDESVEGRSFGAARTARSRGTLRSTPSQRGPAGEQEALRGR
jgi:hypothetical protein